MDGTEHRYACNRCGAHYMTADHEIAFGDQCLARGLSYADGTPIDPSVPTRGCSACGEKPYSHIGPFVVEMPRPYKEVP